MNRTDRLFAILLEFQARREVRAAELATRFEVSVRTIYRDVTALSEGGVPITALPGTGYRLLEGYFLPPLTFTADEAAVLAIGGGFVRDRVDATLRESADEALRKLAGVLPAAQRAAVERRGEELIFPNAGIGDDEATLADLRAAIRERQVVRLLYHAARRPGPEPRDVEPVRLAWVEAAWHLAAYCRLRQAPRLFKLGRIDHFERLPERYEPGARHTVDPDRSRLSRFPEARVRFDRTVERWARERQPFTFRREEADATGPIFVYALRDETELAGWLMSWGAAVEVLAPASLRRRLAAEARAMAARHADEDTGYEEHLFDS